MTNKQLFEQNQRLVFYVFNKYFKFNKNSEDIIQTGNLGLWKACINFDFNKGKFSTFAVSCIKKEILTYLRNEKKFNCVYIEDLNNFEPTYELESFEILDETKLNRNEKIFVSKVLSGERDLKQTFNYRQIRKIKENLKDSLEVGK